MQPTEQCVSYSAMCKLSSLITFNWGDVRSIVGQFNTTNELTIHQNVVKWVKSIQRRQQCSHVIYRQKGILKLISVVGIFVGESKVESRIIRMDFCIIKPKFGQKWTYFVYSCVIYRWKGIQKLISVVGIFLDGAETDLCIIRMKFYIISNA